MARKICSLLGALLIATTALPARAQESKADQRVETETKEDGSRTDTSNRPATDSEATRRYGVDWLRAGGFKLRGQPSADITPK